MCTAPVTVTLPPDLAGAVDELANARGRSPGELVVEAVARFVLEERQALDRIVEARLRQLDGGGDRPAEDATPPVG